MLRYGLNINVLKTSKPSKIERLEALVKVGFHAGSAFVARDRRVHLSWERLKLMLGIVAQVDGDRSMRRGRWLHRVACTVKEDKLFYEDDIFKKPAEGPWRGHRLRQLRRMRWLK